VEERVKQKQKT